MSSNYFTFNVGGGAIGHFTTHLGVRVDLRYLRAFGLDSAGLQGDKLSFSHFDFWRLNVGLAAKF